MSAAKAYRTSVDPSLPVAPMPAVAMPSGLSMNSGMPMSRFAASLLADLRKESSALGVNLGSGTKGFCIASPNPAACASRSGPTKGWSAYCPLACATPRATREGISAKVLNIGGTAAAARKAAPAPAIASVPIAVVSPVPASMPDSRLRPVCMSVSSPSLGLLAIRWIWMRS